MRLSKKETLAVIEALSFRLADDIEDTEVPRPFYETALRKMIGSRENDG